MFPINKVNTGILNSIRGLCNNRPVKHKRFRHPISIGLLKDADKLYKLIHNNSYDKVVAIASIEYFDFHNRKTAAGTVIRPRSNENLISRILKGRYIGGNNNVTFIREDQENTGTISHELAHTLGQGKEQYKKAKSYCKEFKGSDPNPCEDLKIARGLKATKSNRWRFIENKYSIMNSSNKIGNQWIDRDTFQKIFYFLTNFGTHFPRTSMSNNRLKNREAITISGFYNEKEDIFVVPTKRKVKTYKSTPTFPTEKYKDTPVLTFQFKYNEKILKEIKRPIFEMEIKTLYSDKPPEVKPFDFSHAMASFEIPRNHKNKVFQILVLNPKEKIIYDSKFRIKKNKKPKQQKKKDKNGNFAFLDKTY